MLQVLQMLHIQFQYISLAEFAYKLPTSAYKLPTKKVMKLHILHDSIYMILYNIIYYTSFSTSCNFCSRVAKVARQNVCIACVREKMSHSLKRYVI